MGTFAITMSDGSVAIMQTIGSATVAECIAKWPAAKRSRVVSHRPFDAAATPSDRTFRDAWTLAGTAIVHDMAKARDILRGRLRRERAPLLVELDVAYQRSEEISDAAAKLAFQVDIFAQKQTLRDVTESPAIDAAATVNELKALTLAALTK